MKKVFCLGFLILFVTLAKAQTCDYRLDFAALNIGDLHNRVLLDLQNAKSYEERDMIILNWDFDPSQMGVTKQEYLDRVKRLSTLLKRYGTDYNNIPSNIISNNIKPFIGKILDALNNYTNITELNNSLDQIQSEANNSLVCHDLDAITAGIKTAKSSAYFWVPKENSGSGVGTPFITNQSGKSLCCKWLTDAIFGDVMGATGAVTAIGVGAVIGGALTPGANVAILGGIAISAAFGSVTAAIHP